MEQKIDTPPLYIAYILAKVFNYLSYSSYGECSLDIIVIIDII